MDDTRLLVSYAIWVIIIGLTLWFFEYFSKKHSKLGRLVFLVLVPIWTLITLIKGIEYMYFDNSYYLLSGLGLIGLFAETLPMLILLGGITFTIKYLKFRRKNN